MSSGRSITFRVVLVGAAEVGKTSIIKRLINGTFESNYAETIGASFSTYSHKNTDYDVTLQIWDTAGQEKYQSLGPIYYRSSVAAFAVYDQTDEKSFECLSDWITAFKSAAYPFAKIYVVGNKNDLESQITVPVSKAEKFCAANDYKFFSVSALTGQNIERMFQSLAKDLVQAHDDRKLEPMGSNKSVLVQKGQTPSKQCC